MIPAPQVGCSRLIVMAAPIRSASARSVWFSAAPGVIGRDRGGPGLAEAADQLPDGLGVEPQVGGDGPGLMAEAGPLEDDLPLGYGNGSSHPETSSQTTN